MNDFQFVEQRMERAEHDLAQAKSTIVQRELQLKKALEEIAQLRGDRDHFDQQHRIILQEKNAMQAERDQLKQQLSQAQAACAEFRRFIEAGADPEADQDTSAYAGAEFLCRFNEGKGWLSPDEAKRLERERDVAHNHARQNAKERDEARAQCAAIREALQEIHLSPNYHGYYQNESGERITLSCGPECRVAKALITNAGQDLLQDLEAYRKQDKYLCELVGHSMAYSAPLSRTIKHLVERLERYEKALKFYADRNNYLTRANNPPRAIMGTGEEAREALKGEQK